MRKRSEQTAKLAPLNEPAQHAVIRQQTVEEKRLLSELHTLGVTDLQVVEVPDGYSTCDDGRPVKKIRFTKSLGESV